MKEGSPSPVEAESRVYDDVEPGHTDEPDESPWKPLSKTSWRTPGQSGRIAQQSAAKAERKEKQLSRTSSRLPSSSRELDGDYENSEVDEFEVERIEVENESDVSSIFDELPKRRRDGKEAKKQKRNPKSEGRAERDKVELESEGDKDAAAEVGLFLARAFFFGAGGQVPYVFICFGR
jgi:hypothetical protein